jgi:hypothetical protein
MNKISGKQDIKELKTTAKSRTENCGNTSESTNIKVQIFCHGK